MIKKIDELKSEITLTFMRTQNLIISSYFDNSFDKIIDLEGVENYRRKLYNFKPLLGSTEGYSFFNDYYINKMEELEHKYNLLESGEFETTALKLITKRESKFKRIIRALKKLIFGTSTSTENVND